MRGSVFFACFILLTGCQKDFDAQYAETERKVKATEAKIDAEMAKEAKREPGANGNSD
jgi:hypothetical protein